MAESSWEKWLKEEFHVKVRIISWKKAPRFNVLSSDNKVKVELSYPNGQKEIKKISIWRWNKETLFYNLYCYVSNKERIKKAQKEVEEMDRFLEKNKK